MTPAAGENIAVLRKSRGIGQARLARQAGISLSYLSKIEVGTRPATPPVVAAVAKALRVSTARIYGQPFLSASEQADLLDALRVSVRRHTLPRQDAPPLDVLATGLATATALRAQTKYVELLRILPTLLEQATAVALAGDGDPAAWGQVADLYGCGYAVAHRLGQPDLAEMVVARQTWAAEQTWNPEADAAAAWNEAGTYQSAGQYDDGLAIIERAISRLESARFTGGPAKIVPLGSLHLRGVVLASRHKDAQATKDHLTRAWKLAKSLGGEGDMVRHNLTFGSGNTALYELAAHVELGRPDKAAAMGDTLMEQPPGDLTPNRVGRLYIDVARARLAVKNTSGAEEALKAAFTISPEMAEMHPMAREVLRVLFVLHQRAKPELMTMAKRAGLTV
ncbi:helix-turn-helix transcriptional regulator [Streptomyces sp. ICBB 8177]|uniref:helix-turn-helix domain-containing protein n=1 Tax=Streptomyces sp. ICBB 8177 TaxID=563922 RepID=UPI000D678AAE|nr:helix-turn-helix transcriptional regulator [Streptomyces sp. ICBB 8177]PWI45365.1 hypothetical protein CK485_04300 [Streptomyces sp. ICBB 8177]